MRISTFGPALAFAGGLALAGCAPATQYEGIALPAGGMPPEVALIDSYRRGAGIAALDLAPLAALAQGGNKHAQLELGIRFEEGRDVPADPKRARRLYALAGQRTGGSTAVYLPPVRKGGHGRVMFVNRGPVVMGLPAAQARLAALEARLRAERAGAAPLK